MIIGRWYGYPSFLFLFFQELSSPAPENEASLAAVGVTRYVRCDNATALTELTKLLICATLWRWGQNRSELAEWLVVEPLMTNWRAIITINIVPRLY